VIHQAALQTGDTLQPVAVKLFKGDVTSDGLPQNEMAACLRAGQHPHLIPVIGTVPDHPAGVSAMVMALIAPTYRNLAGPPSLDSCTRDVYADGIRFERSAVIRIALGIVSAAQHLHERGVTHGDLYAHNILINPDGHSLLGDFGAASFFSTEDLSMAWALQAIEVRAVGCLLEELLARCDEGDTSPTALTVAAELTALTAACLHEAPVHRPRLAQVERTLTRLSRLPV
jgi:serine/threonine protein kinase